MRGRGNTGFAGGPKTSGLLARKVLACALLFSTAAVLWPAAPASADNGPAEHVLISQGEDGGTRVEPRTTSRALDWPKVTAECRPWAYNWWLGSAVDPENLARELRRYRAGGLGGIHVIPIYGAKGAEERYIEYLSPKWMKMLTFAVEEAARLGLGVDMTTGTGWCFGGPNITPELGGRSAVVERIPFPADGKLPDTGRQKTLQALVAVGPDGESRNVTDRRKPDGSLAWKPPADGWSLLVLDHRFTRRMVKRAAPGGAGPMINPFYAEAMREYLKRFSAALDAPGVAKPRAMYHDSFEYRSDWSPDLPEQFARRRGYRVEDELAALAGQGDRERVARVRCDVSETLSDLIIEDVFPQWVRWCHQRGIRTRNQAHGAPANWLDFYALADIPETEVFGHGGPDPLVSRLDEHIAGADRDPLVCKFASSAAHTAGRTLTGCETGTWLAEHFCETFEELKCEMDLLFLAGVNHIVYHGCVYSPDDAAWPGWLFYASTQMNPRNPLWREAAALNAYVARCQSMLQAGLPDNDVLLYWPIHDSWSQGVKGMTVHNKLALKGALGQTARTLWARGYGFDYVSDRLLDSLEIREGAIVGPGGVAWQTVVVPPCRYLPHTTLEKLLELAGQGTTVVFQDHLPVDVPGLGKLNQRRAVLRRLLEPLSPPEPTPAVHEVRQGKGRVLIGALQEALQLAHVARESLVDHAGVQFIRRRHRHGRHYFVVHHGLKPLDTWARLATPAQAVLVMDPLTGDGGLARKRKASNGDTEVYLRLEPGHSTFLRTFERDVTDAPKWSWPRPADVLTEIDGPWQVEFVAGGPKLPKPRKFHKLGSWTAGDDPAAVSFAGTARYRCRFDGPAGGLDTQPGAALMLDLGDVKHVARVRINDQDLGVLFMHPYRLAIPGDLLRPKGNELDVEVTNLAANRIRDLDRRQVAWRIFHDINLVRLDYKAFDASNWPVFDSGLLGPVRIRRVTLPE